MADTHWMTQEQKDRDSACLLRAWVHSDRSLRRNNGSASNLFHPLWSVVSVNVRNLMLAADWDEAHNLNK